MLSRSVALTTVPSTTQALRSLTSFSGFSFTSHSCVVSKYYSLVAHRDIHHGSSVSSYLGTLTTRTLSVMSDCISSAITLSGRESTVR